MRHPPSLGDLADAVGLSEKRLNAGFRLLFDATPLQYLRRGSTGRGARKA